MHAPFTITYFGPTVYVLRGHGDEVLYVGMSEFSWPDRLAAHNRTRWGAWIRSAELHPCKDRNAAMKLEGRLIRKLRPTYNVMMNHDPY